MFLQILKRLLIVAPLLLVLAIGTAEQTSAATQITNWTAPNDDGCLFNGGDTLCLPATGELVDIEEIPQSYLNGTPSGWSDAAIKAATGDVYMDLYNNEGKWIKTIPPNQPLTDLGRAKNKVKFVRVRYKS